VSGADKKRTIILGSGFGGIHTFRELHRQFHNRMDAPEVTIVSPRDSFLYSLLLHEVATGGVSASSLIQSIRKIGRCRCGLLRNVIAAEARAVDTQREVITTTAGELSFEYAVVGIGFPKRVIQRQRSARHDGRTPNRLERFIRKTFPALAQVRFERYWPGLIGVTRDLLPLAGLSLQHPEQLQAVCAAGLPWSVLAGQTAARAITGASTSLDDHFSPAGHFELAGLTSMLPVPLSFALSHLHNMHSGRKEAG
jgi:hypothetical protein